ncbi:MAG: hypothetical protein P1U87_22335 [Verrucomicrobiales bacterium]|nr:hypothetical protein [Verrucomicrobiales bacterium]
MTSIKSYLLTPFIGIFLICLTSLEADEIKMKDGTTHTGRITYEADDIVKIEIAISASIKETKILSRADILNITKDRPEDIEFNKLQKLIPTPSLMSAGAYKSAIETGPDPFLKNFPDSIHVEPVKKIKATLEEELDKVERGFIKVEEDWISPQEKVKYETLVNSRIRFLRMQAASRTRNYNGIINAMRELEYIEENFHGTPALPKAVNLGLQLMPTLGQQLLGMRRDVEYRNAEFEKNKEQMDPVAKAQVEAARAREEANYAAGLAADKKAGIKWVRLNANSKTSIESYLKLVDSEMKHLKAYDLNGLTKQSEVLVEVDQAIDKGDLRLAKAKLEEAAGISTRVEGSSGKKSSSKKGRKGSYASILKTKIAQASARAEELAKAREKAAESQNLAENLKKENTSSLPTPSKDEEEVDPEAVAEKKKEAADAFAALAQSSKKNEDSKSKESSSKSKPKEKQPRDEEDYDKDRPSAAPSGGGISMSLIIPIVTVLLLVTVVLLKVLGIGSKKEE